MKPIVEKKGGIKTEKKKSVKRKSEEKGKNVNEDEEDDFYNYCDKCLNKFSDWKELQKHKIYCVKVPQKFSCSKCNKGFQQKTMMEQHFDFYHTKKTQEVCVQQT